VRFYGLLISGKPKLAPLEKGSNSRRLRKKVDLFFLVMGKAPDKRTVPIRSPIKINIIPGKRGHEEPERVFGGRREGGGGSLPGEDVCTKVMAAARDVRRSEGCSWFVVDVIDNSRERWETEGGGRVKRGKILPPLRNQ